jgi:hypothetical protein
MVKASFWRPSRAICQGMTHSTTQRNAVSGRHDAIARE